MKLFSTYLINRLPSPVIQNQTPFERLFHQTPNYEMLRTFGCACWPNLHPYNNHKLQFRSKQCIFLGYSIMHKGFKCLDPSTGRVYITTTETLICPGWETSVAPVSQPGTPGRDKRGCPFVSGLAIGTKSTLLSRLVVRQTKGPFFCSSFLNYFSISIILLHFN